MGKKIKYRTKEEKIDIHKKHIQTLLKKIEYHNKQIEKLEEETTDYKFLLRDKRWFEKRNEILELYGKICKNCGSTKTLNVHHIYYNHSLKPWEYPNDAYLVLCKDCHNKIHNIK